MEVAQGHVSDRPFARTIYAIAAKRFTGDLILTEANRRYKISWEDGRAVAAESPSPADSVGRVALSAGLATSTHVSRSLELMAQSPGTDALEVLIGLARLSADQVTRLKRRLLAHRASRVFGLPDATFVLDNARSLRADADVPPLDARWLIYYGLKTHYLIERLDRELTPVATRPLTLAADAAGVLSAFGFGDAERGVLERLRQRAWTVQHLVDASPEVERRIVLAVMYSLVTTDCLEQGESSAAPEVRPPPVAAPPVNRPGPPSRPPLAQGTERRIPYGAGTPGIPGPQSKPVVPPAARPAGSTSAPPPIARTVRTSAAPPIAHGTHQSLLRRSRPTSGHPPADPAAEETRRLISDKVRDLDVGASHFQILGVGQGASADEVRNAYFALAKRLHPDRLRAVGVLEHGAAVDAQRLFARINQAFGILSDPQRRSEYLRVMSAGGEEAVKKTQQEAEERAIRALRAEESFRMGEMALRRTQFVEACELFEQAVELNPEEAEFQALLAWSTWLAAPDKVVVATAVQRRLAEALALQPKCVPAHFYLGQVAKHAGRTQAAIESFKRVLELQPDHADANLELRVLLGREKGPESKRGIAFLDKLKKK